MRRIFPRMTWEDFWRELEGLKTNPITPKEWSWGIPVFLVTFTLVWLALDALGVPRG